MPQKKGTRKSITKSQRKLVNRASQAQLVKAIGMKVVKQPSLLRTGGFSFKGQGGQELNFIDTVLSSAVISTTAPYMALLNGCQPGSGNSQRIGRRIDMKSIELRFSVQNLGLAEMTLHRAMIVLDKQANGAAFSYTDLMIDGEPTGLRNISNKARFTVIWDGKLHALIGNIAAPSTTTNCTANSGCAYTAYKKINIQTQYNSGTAGTVADIQTNSLYFIIYGDQLAVNAATNGFEVGGYCRIRYIP